MAEAIWPYTEDPIFADEEIEDEEKEENDE